MSALKGTVLADSLRWYTLQVAAPFSGSDVRRSESKEGFPGPEGLLEGAIFYFVGAIFLALLHAVLTHRFNLLEVHLMLGFPYIEIHLLKVLFGAMCISSAMASVPDSIDSSFNCALVPGSES